MPPTRSRNELLEEFTSRAETTGVRLDESDRERILQYCDLLAEYNSHTNLVARADLETLLFDHVLDSLTLVPAMRKAAALSNVAVDRSVSLVDIGSGAGFPGMVLAIASHEMKCVLVDSVGKKCRFLESAAETLGLSDRVEVVCGRAEELGRSRRESFSFATARAVGSLVFVAELAVPLLARGGVFLAQRSKRQVEEELDDAVSFIEKLGGDITTVLDLGSQASGKEFCVVAISKRRPTPGAYPRTTAQISAQEKSRRRKV